MFKPSILVFRDAETTIQGGRREYSFYASRGCSYREIARSLHISVGAVHNLCQLHLPKANRSCGGRPRLMSRVEERIFVLEMVRGRVGTCVDAARQVNLALGIQVTRQTIMYTLIRAGLHS